MNLSSNAREPGLSVVAGSELYLDAASTTPPLPAVIEAMRSAQQGAWANPSSLHGHGVRAAEALERARLTMAALLDAAPEDLIFTSGATESVHLALLGSAAAMAAGRLVISSVEHPAVVAAAERLVGLGWRLELWPVDAQGLIRLDQLDRLLSPPTRLVSLIWGQSEVGSVQPLIPVAQACRQRGIRFHSDATQLIPQGRVSWSELPVDLLSFSAHKFQGPRGVGLLLTRRDLPLSALQGGGGQEQGLRSGTEPVALVAGCAQAMTALPAFDAMSAAVPPGACDWIRPCRDQLLEQLLTIPGVRAVGPDCFARLPHHISLLIGTADGRPLSGRALVRQLSRNGVAASSGTACRSGAPTDSAVLSAMQVERIWRRSGLRLSLGPWLSKADLCSVPQLLEQAIHHVQHDV